MKLGPCSVFVLLVVIVTRLELIGTSRPLSPVSGHVHGHLLLHSTPTRLKNNLTSSASSTVPVRGSPVASLLKNDWIGNGHLQFTFDLLNGIFMNNLDLKTGNLESVAFSPFSIQSLLMMVHLGTKGATKAELAKVLHLESSENNVTFSKSHEAFGQAVRSLLEDKQVGRSLHSANQIFVQDNLSLANTYVLALKNYHGSTIKYVDFADDAYQVLNIINNWIEKQTQHMISNFLTNPPSPKTTLMAVNAVRFKGDWQYRFDPTDTEKEAWFRMFNGQTTKVEMMVAQLPVAYAHSAQLKTSIIELPFKASRLSFFLLLPDETFGLFSLLNSLNSTVFANLIYSMRKINGQQQQQQQASSAALGVSLYNLDKTVPTGVNIRIPKFSVNSMPRITQILKHQLGLKTLFSHEDANLEAMFNRPMTRVHMDELLHKAILKVDEFGSMGAAVSSSSIERVGTFNGPYFEADHPFVFLLMDKQTGLALFAGIYGGPSSNSDNVNIQGNNNNNNKGPAPAAVNEQHPMMMMNNVNSAGKLKPNFLASFNAQRQEG